MEPASASGLLSALLVASVLGSAVDARDATWLGETAYVATTGGLVQLAPGEEARVLSTAEGLPDGTVRALHAEGALLWVGTDRGLAAVDAEGRVSARTQTASPVTSLSSDGEGGLFVGTLHGLWRRDASGQLREIEGAPERVTDALMHRGSLYVSGQGWGVRVFDGSRWQRTRVDALAWDLEVDGDAVLVATSAGVTRLRGTRASRSRLTRSAERLPVQDVRALRLVGGELLVGTCGAGAFVVSASATRALTAGDARCVHALATRGAEVIIASAEGAYAVHPDAVVTSLLPPGLPDPDTASLARTAEGLWVGSFRSGLALVRPDGSVRRWDESTGLLDDRINRLAVDGEGDLWIATDRGVLERTQGRFELRGLLDQHVVFVAWDGARMLAATGQDVLAWDATREALLPLQIGRRAQDVLPGPGDAVTATAEGLVLGAAERRDVVVAGPGSLPDDWTTALARVDETRFAVGTYSSGVAMLRGGQVETLREDLWVNVGAMHTLVLEGRPVLCVGTLDDGLWLYDGEAWARMGVREGLPDEDVTSIVDDGEGGLWVGTRGGVAHLVPAPTTGS